MVTLKKLYPHCLVKQPRLLSIRPAGKALQAEKPGCVAFINGNFQVACGVEQCQLFTFFNICISFGDRIDHLIPLEGDLKAASATLLLELVMGNIDNNILDRIEVLYGPSSTVYGSVN